MLLFRGSRSRSELVATFMAVLELCRNHIIRLAGSAADCTVTCQETEEDMSVEDTMEMKEIEAAVEGILFASGEPVHIDRICLAAEHGSTNGGACAAKAYGLLQL